MDSVSPERLYISYPHINENIKKHFLRYKFALQFSNGKCLDCACGSGYGSNMLSERCSKVFGVDKSKDAIEYAKKNNQKDNIIFSQDNISDLSFAQNYFDTIVSLETIEHITQGLAKKFFENIDSILKIGGTFICSSPMLRFVDGEPYITSPYHVNEMDRYEFLSLINKYFLKYTKHFYHQEDGYFVPLGDENTGFCIVVMRKNG